MIHRGMRTRRGVSRWRHARCNGLLFGTILGEIHWCNCWATVVMEKGWRSSRKRGWTKVG